MTRILGIETSCDETAAAVVEDGTRVRSSVVASQHDLHERYRGVVPEIASRAHLENILPTVSAALSGAGSTLDDLDAVAVGNRPGLIGSLLVGVSAAQALAWSLEKPLIGIDHVQAHLWAAFLDADASAIGAEGFPALGLVVSGGHTSLYRLASPTDLTLIGRTIDDAAGEAFDKAAVILGLGYPGGPAIDRDAKAGDAARYGLPRSSLGSDSLDFSFSGLKTALLYAVRGHPVGRGAAARFERSESDLTDGQRRDLAASFQAAVVDALLLKIQRAWMRYPDAQTLIVGGGVSANSLLRTRLENQCAIRGIPLRLPALEYSVDNAAMIAGLAYARLREGTCDPLDLPAIATTAT